jgi:hypothetical protein
MRTRLPAVAAVVSSAAALVLNPAVASAKPVSNVDLKALTNSVNRAKHLTYSATYTAVAGGKTSTVTIAQKPPKSNFSASGGQVINNGKTTYYCSNKGGTGGGAGASGGTGTSGGTGSTGNTGSSGNSGAATGKTTCVAVHGSNPLLGLEDAFSPTLALRAVAVARQGIVSRLLGTKVSSSSATFAGQPSTCVTVSVRGRSAKYCVTKQGVLAYSGTSSDYLMLTAYSSNPPAGLFTLPAGATTQNVPRGSPSP